MFSQLDLHLISVRMRSEAYSSQLICVFVFVCLCLVSSTAIARVQASVSAASKSCFLAFRLVDL